MTDGKQRTAAELMAELEADDSWVAGRDARERNRQQLVLQNNEDGACVLAAVAEVTGVEVGSIAELREISSPGVVAVLIEWLPRIDNVQVKRDIASVLAGEWARPAAAVPLIDAFESADGGGSDDGLRWSIASALLEVADSSVTHRLVRLVQDRSNGDARQMLALALGRTGDEAAVPILVELLGDYTVAGHAVIALAGLHAEDARPAIEKLRSDDRAWVREEVRRALAEL